MCGATAGGVSTDGVDMSTESVIEGQVSRAGSPVDGAYVRLLDSGGDFTAEVPTSATGSFRFFAAPGTWTVRVLAPGAAAERSVVADRGSVTEVQIRLDA
jgi:hypothetical protein